MTAEQKAEVVRMARKGWEPFCIADELELEEADVQAEIERVEDECDGPIGLVYQSVYCAPEHASAMHDAILAIINAHPEWEGDIDDGWEGCGE